MSGPEGNPALLEIVRREIADRGTISFARFMDLALYHPEHGYYGGGGPDHLGRGGDFFTACDLGNVFGACLARQLVEMDERLGQPSPFVYVEIGAGRGILARHVVDAIVSTSPALAARLRTVLVDASPSMREAAAGRLPGADVVTPEGLPRGIEGCVVAVELFDALPVHRLRRRGGRLVEVCVGVTSDGRLTEVEAAPDDAARRWAERWGAAPDDGDEAEACPRALDVIDRIAAVLERGFACVVDYGHDAQTLRDRAHRRGTLLGYRRHAVTEELLGHVGEQDLTAHVNFSALEERAAERGLAVLGRTTQDRFLVALGLLDRFEAPTDESWREPGRLRDRLHAMQLLHPAAMGRRFHALLLGRGVDLSPPLAGLRDPFAPSREAGRGPLRA